MCSHTAGSKKLLPQGVGLEQTQKTAASAGHSGPRVLVVAPGPHPCWETASLCLADRVEVTSKGASWVPGPRASSVRPDVPALTPPTFLTDSVPSTNLSLASGCSREGLFPRAPQRQGEKAGMQTRKLGKLTSSGSKKRTLHDSKTRMSVANLPLDAEQQHFQRHKLVPHLAVVDSPYQGFQE